MCFAAADIPSRNWINPNAELPITRQCELLGVSRSTYYYRPIDPDPEVAKMLQGEGFNVGRKLVRSYMREMAIYPIYPKPNLSKRNYKQAVMPYLLRNMNIFMPNQVWSIDYPDVYVIPMFYSTC